MLLSQQIVDTHFVLKYSNSTFCRVADGVIPIQEGGRANEETAHW
jgi:hypothetical protein